MPTFRPSNASRYLGERGHGQKGGARVSMAVPYGKPRPSPYRRILRIFAGFLLLVATMLALRIFVVAPFGIPSESMLPRLMVGDYILVTKWNYGYSRHSLPFASTMRDGRFWAAMPARGDIVVFKAPPENHDDFIKRVIGLPGDHVQVREGQLFINGAPIAQVQMDDFVTPITPVMREAAKKSDNANPCFQPAFQERGKGGDRCRYPQFREILPPHHAYATLNLYPSLDIDNTRVFVVPKGHLFLMGDNRDRSADSRLPASPGGAIGMVPMDNLVGRASVVIFSVDGSANWYNPASWIKAVRWNRVGERI